MSRPTHPGASRHPSQEGISEKTPLRWWRGVALALAVGLVGAQIAEIPWRHALRGFDNTFNYLWLRSLAVDGDWSFANDVATAPSLTPEDQVIAGHLIHPETGRVLNKYGIGWAVLTAPAYFFADGIVGLGRLARLWTLERDGWNPVYQVCIVVWHVALAFLALGLARAVLRRWIDEPWATAGLVTVWLASPLPYYQMANISMSHGTVFLAVTVAAWALIRGLEEPHQRWAWFLAGAALGLAMSARFQAALFGIFALWAVVARIRNHGWRGANVVLWLGAGAMPFILLQVLAWQTIYGHWLTFSYGAEGEKFSWTQPAWREALGSAHHGLLYWHPLLAVGMIGLVAWLWPRRGPASAALAAVVGNIYINAAWWCWWFGAAFGGRAFDAALLAVMAGQGIVFSRLGRRRRVVLWVACGVFAAWNIYVLLLFRTSAIARDDPVTWTEMFSAAPRLGEVLKFE